MEKEFNSLNLDEIAAVEDDELEENEKNIELLKYFTDGGNKVDRESMIAKIYKWGDDQGISLKQAGGRSFLSDGTEKLEIKCSAQDCKFRLIFWKKIST